MAFFILSFIFKVFIHSLGYFTSFIHIKVIYFKHPHPIYVTLVIYITIELFFLNFIKLFHFILIDCQSTVHFRLLVVTLVN